MPARCSKVGMECKEPELVIAGISGRYPEAENVDEFKKNLYEHVNMVTSDNRRWPVGLYDLPENQGKIKELTKFDASFFSVHPKQADRLDPMIRMMLEATHEAIMDAGFNPEEVKGSNTGVYVGVSGSDSWTFWACEIDKISGYGLLGCELAMFSNRISYTFDFKGPSFTLDTACSSSGVALHLAVTAIKRGEIDAAIIGGVNINLKPALSVQFDRLSMLSHPGVCKAFDASGDGYVRSEAVVVFYIRKAADARRVYASIVNTGINCDGNKEQGITFPNGSVQKELIERVFTECGLDPTDIDFIECHGTGTKIGDPQELNSVAEYFCPNRKTPLLVGSVKSNMGHSEPASALCSMTKVILTMEEGLIPANLHYKNPNKDIPALLDGRIKVVDKNLEWKGGYIAINSFGFGGANAHIILKSNPKPKQPAVKDNIPRLVCVSGRTEEAVDHILKFLESRPRDDDLITLLHKIHSRHIPGHNFRGYTVLEAKDKKEICESNDKKEIWYVFNGMGSQWGGMGKALMVLEPFSTVIHRCAKALKPFGVDLLNLFNTGDETSFNNVINSFVGITSIQVGLVEVLKSLGVEPDGVVGHSAGEVSCAFADGCLTVEQTVIVAYWRGKTILDSGVQPGAMAAVGMTWEEAKQRCPSSIVPACHNAETSVTISGPEVDIDAFVQTLQSENIFAKKVHSSGLAFHSPYIAKAAQPLQKHLTDVITSPKPRTKRWLSSSVPEAAWGSEITKTASPEYFVNNLISPVLFHEVVQKIPEDAIVIEIGPHSLLQAILKRAVPKSCLNIGLLKKQIPDEVGHLMANIGKLFIAGKSPDLTVFHKPSSFPVARGTPMISPLIKWDHSHDWAVASYKLMNTGDDSSVEIDISKDSDAYIKGHTIDGRVLFPATGYLTLIWNAYAKLKERKYTEFPVTMTNVNFLRATIMPKEGVVKFCVNINEASGSFELSESGSTVVTGQICVSEGIQKEGLNLTKPPVKNDILPLEKDEIYKDLRLRGYDYQGIFKGVKSSDNYGTQGILEWNDNWISFMDTMLQFSLVGMNTRELYLPTRILRITIDPQAHLKSLNGASEIQVEMYKNTGVIKSGGVEIRGMKASQAPRRIGVQAFPKTEQYRFIPYNVAKETPWEEALMVMFQLILENSQVSKLKVAEVYQRSITAENLLTPSIVKILESEPYTMGEIKVFGSETDSLGKILDPLEIKAEKKDLNIGPVGNNLHLVVTSGIINEPQCLNNALSSVSSGGFVLTIEDKQNIVTNGSAVEVISKIRTDNKTFVLLRKVESWKMPQLVQIDSDLNWVEPLKKAIKQAENNSDKFLLVSQNEPNSGIIGLFNCLKKEPGGEHFRCVFITDDTNINLSQHTDQLKKDLLINVYKDGEWGSLRHIALNTQDMALEVHHAYINTLVKGDLSSLKWIEGPLAFHRPEHDNIRELCTVYYATLNFKDVMLASGKLPPDSLPGRQSEMECILGFEFAGRDSKGERTMGIVTAQAMATSVLSDKSLRWPIPPKWTMEQAATIPAVYATCYYALMTRGRMQRGERILIHAGTGGVGQAAIRIALSMGCEVFTTVGSKAKKEFLLKTFPLLKHENIGNSRDDSFEQLILERTEGEGVHIVLNSLAGDMLQASVRCLAEGGRFLEIGKADISQNSPIGMAILKKSVAVHGILLDALFEIEGEAPVKKEIRDLIQNGIDSGVVQPLQTNTYHHSKVEQAFRFMASGKHIGKVILEIKKEESAQVVTDAKPQRVRAIPKTYLSPDKSYIVLGGLGGFGLELANWLLIRGAKRLILVSRKGVTSGYQALCLRRWKERGYNVTISTEDATTMNGARRMLEQANKLAPVGGIFNLAAVLRDSYLDKQTKEDFEAVCRVKVDTTKNLDIASRSLCPQLDYFVVFSSVSCGRGNAGQTNYGYANSVMERLCESRKASVLPGVAIQWGAVGDVGLIIDGMKGDNETVVGGTIPQRINSCLQTLDSFLQTPYPVLASMVLAETRRKGKDSSISVVDIIGNILGVKTPQNIPNSNTLADLGMDSLMGAEIKQVLERGYDLIMSPAEIRNITFGKLREIDSGNEDKENKTETEAEILVKYKDRLMPVETLVKLKPGENTKRGPYFFIHAIEGTITALQYIAEAVKIPEEIYGLQCTLDVPTESIKDMAAAYIKEMKKIQPKGPYRMVAYSFGCTIAYEMALQIENEHKEEVFIVFLDGSPTYTLTHIRQYRKNRNEEADVADAYAFFFTTVDPKTNVLAIQKEIRAIPTEEKRLEMIASKLKPLLNYSEKEIKEAAWTFSRKLLAGDVYTPSLKLNCNAVLIHAEDNFVSVDLADSVKEYCTKNVTVHQMKGNHRSILSGESGHKIAEIISKLQ